ncbi:MAG: PorT family protein [Prevotella sp.]|nr:PorT family protein [Prevotella sp.]
MKKIFMMAVMAVAALTASAQNAEGQVTLMPKAGINISSITNIDNAKSKVGFVGGVEAEYGLPSNFAVSAGILFSMQGAKSKVNDNNVKLNYLNIPILCNYYVWKGLAVKAGVQPGFRLSAKVNDDDIKNRVKSFDFSIPVGVSYEYQKFVLDARYNIGVTKANDDGNDSERNSVFAITLGYKFAL